VLPPPPPPPPPPPSSPPSHFPQAFLPFLFTATT
jgi:hypothetical protein